MDEQWDRCPEGFLALNGPGPLRAGQGRAGYHSLGWGQKGSGLPVMPERFWGRAGAPGSMECSSMAGMGPQETAQVSLVLS